MIIPSIDLLNGLVVRLIQGNYDKQHFYQYNVVSQIKKYFEQGAKVVHLVDLNGAKNAKYRQVHLILNILKKFSSKKIQVGGGIRSIYDCDVFLESGAFRLVIGSIAIKNFKEVSLWLKKFGTNCFVLALDMRLFNDKKYKVATNAWTKFSNQSYNKIIKYYFDLGLNNVLCTNILSDGMLSGVNVNLYKKLCYDWPNIKFQASGGISSCKDILSLKKNGISSIIIGRALLENRFTISKAIKCWQKE